MSNVAKIVQAQDGSTRLRLFSSNRYIGVEIMESDHYRAGSVALMNQSSAGLDIGWFFDGMHAPPHAPAYYDYASLSVAIEDPHRDAAPFVLVDCQGNETRVAREVYHGDFTLKIAYDTIITPTLPGAEPFTERKEHACAMRFVPMLAWRPLPTA